jgi:8-oxo-dGTP pyrophosphatase MutT (NUDIX family)
MDRRLLGPPSEHRRDHEIADGKSYLRQQAQDLDAVRIHTCLLPGLAQGRGTLVRVTRVDGAAALREAREETGVDPDGIEILGLLPEVGLPVSNFMVTPVLGWWAEQSPIHAVDTAESELVFRAPVSTLLDPVHRRTAVVRRDGFVSRTPAFLVPEAVIWGFTAMLLDAMFDGLGWTRAWDRSREIPAPL